MDDVEKLRARYDAAVERKATATERWEIIVAQDEIETIDYLIWDEDAEALAAAATFTTATEEMKALRARPERDYSIPGGGRRGGWGFGAPDFAGPPANADEADSAAAPDSINEAD